MYYDSNRYYLYHMFFAWIICSINGYFTRYHTPVESGALIGSIGLTLACITLPVSRVVIEDKTAATIKAKKENGPA